MVDMVFAERAYWLYPTGRGRATHASPSGNMAAAATGISKWPVSSLQGKERAGTDVNVPIPTSEYVNPLFHGCLSQKQLTIDPACAIHGCLSRPMQLVSPVRIGCSYVVALPGATAVPGC